MLSTGLSIASRFKWWAVVIALAAGMAVFAVMTMLARQDAGDLDLQLTATAASLSGEQEAHHETRAELTATSESLTGAERQIRSHETEIADLRDSVDALMAQNDSLSNAIESLETEGSSLLAQVVQLQDELDNLDGQKVRVEAAVRDLEDEKADLESENETLGGANDKLFAQVSSLAEEKNEIQDLNRRLTAQKATLTELNDRLEREQARLSEEVEDFRAANESVTTLEGQISELEGQIGELGVAIRELEEQRKPLILKTFNSNPRCTGSMEPKVTCLDTTVMLENFRPEDIVAGTIIIYDDPTQEGDTILHRVADVKVEGDIHYFWPKGDAVDEPDGYWVSQDDVIGYLIGLEENSRMVNFDLRKKVNDSRKDLDAKTEQLTMEHERYREIALRYCGTFEADSTCQGSQSDFRRVSRAYDRYIEVHGIYSNAYCDYEYTLHQGKYESEPTPIGSLRPYLPSTPCFDYYFAQLQSDDN